MIAKTEGSGLNYAEYPLVEDRYETFLKIVESEFSHLKNVSG